MIMTRQEYLEERLEKLEERVAADSRCLQQLTRNVDRHYAASTRDSLISVAIRLHDTRVERQAVRDELRHRAKAAALLD
jgi:uncharacterized coiled-coil protein SlyX